jgi:hypothetical protein
MLRRLIASSLSEGIETDGGGGEIDTFFTSVIRQKNVYVCRLLLKLTGPDILKGHHGHHALIYACDVSSEEIVMTIAEAVDDNTLKSTEFENGTNLLINAYRRRMFHLVRYLLIRGLDPHSQDDQGRSLMELLVSGGNYTLVELLLDHYGMKATELDSSGNPMIFRSLIEGNSMVSELLLKSGVDPNITDKDGVPLLEWTVRKGWYLHTSHLLRNGCKCIYDNEPLFHRLCHIAIQNHSSIIFHKLMSNYMATIIQRAWRKWRVMTDT